MDDAPFCHNIHGQYDTGPYWLHNDTNLSQAALTYCKFMAIQGVRIEQYRVRITR
ncbi:hypothetical protein GCM10007872_30260 [Gluconobacter sphaericus NBRC 12467]|uniref:Uncharacterized protein n=1 Tax=Gluconobacter sphaericus NBRC 12467 TaxID=1307951 RepID=A0AA37SM27_9PROT|nr:hypothetical protein GCM10007872_30260 [Gluconobacter sphaericus NBRC 12467]